MKDLDTNAIIERLAALDGYEATLRDLARIPMKEIVSDAIKLHALERVVQLAAQVMIDIGSHLISALGFRTPKDHKDIFKVLAEEGVWDSDLAKRLSGLAGMRNILVHMYLQVDVEKLYRGVLSGVDDLAEFAQAIARLIRSYSDSIE